VIDGQGGDFDSLYAVVSDLLRAYDKHKDVWPPQDVADFMGDIRAVIERARRLIEYTR